MTDTKEHDVCRVMAEQMISEDCNLRYRAFKLSGSKTEYEKLCGSLIELIRNHTVLPELIKAAKEYLDQTIRCGVPTKERNAKKRLCAILIKAEGR